MKWWFIGGIAVILGLMGLALFVTAPLAHPQGGRYFVFHTGVREPGESSEEGEGGGTLVLALSAEPGQLDPQSGGDPGLNLVLPYLFDTLVARDANRGIIPALAQTWETVPDGMLTMHLKPGVYFQDGDPLTADAVRRTFKRFKQVGQLSPVYNTVSKITAIDVLDELTVRFTFDGPVDDLLNTLATPWAGIISPESAQSQSGAGARRMVGTGPFMLGDWQKGESITLVRNNGYHWAPELYQNRRSPYVQALLFKVIPDVRASVEALEARQVDVVVMDHPEQIAELRNDPGLEVGPQGLAYRKGIFGLRMGALHQLLLNDAKVPGN